MVTAAIAALATVGAATVPSADSAARVVGGTDAPAGSWPALVALVTDGQTPSVGQFCGGTLIDPAWVLTAAHCITDVNGAVVPAASLDVVAGLTNLATDTGQASNVTTIVRHPSYVDGDFRNDVALLHLESPVVPGATVATMELVSPLRPELWDAASPAEIAGWGDTLLPPPANLPNALQQAQVPIVSDATCAATNLGSGPPPVFVSTEMVCAGQDAGGVDTCQGDSGGPLTVLDGSTRVLVGAVSWGVGCALPNLPGVYTRLDAYRGFIFGSTGLNQSSPATPVNVDATPTASQVVTVTWTEPASASRPITGYAVRTLHAGVPGPITFVPGVTTTTTINGLTPGADDTFTVAAAQAVGVGPAARVAAHTPENTALPAVTGVTRRGAVLNGTAGGWKFSTGQPVAYQWQRCDALTSTCADIAGATQPTVTLVQADIGQRIRLHTSATNNKGANSADSAFTAVVFPPTPANVSTPSVSGTAQVGAALHATVGSWTDLDSSTITWQACDAAVTTCTDIPGATGPIFVPTASHVGQRLRVDVTASNPSGSVHASSEATAPVIASPPARLTIVRLRPPAVTQTSRGIITVRMRVNVGAGATLSVRVLDHRGRLRVLNQVKSRIGGRRATRVNARRLSSVVGATGVVEISIVFAGNSRNPRRIGRLALQATHRGRRATLNPRFRARF